MSGQRWESEEEYFDADDEQEDPEGPQECDLDGDEGEEYDVVECPSCGREISELSERCPYCGDWVTAGAGRSKRGPIITVIAILLLISFLIWVL